MPPYELASLGLERDSFVRADSKSWRGPCPQCGGHRRFVIFTDNPWPLYHGFCDECGCKIRAWEKVKTQYDPQRAAAISAERVRVEAEQAEYRRETLDFLRRTSGVLPRTDGPASSPVADQVPG